MKRFCVAVLVAAFGLVSSAWPQAGAYSSPAQTGSANVIVAFSATPTFTTAGSASAFTITDFFMLLTGNVTSSTVAGSFKQGDEVVITLQQDGTGGRTFVWPANFLNTPTVGANPNAVTAMTFQYCGAGNAACPAGDWQATDVGPVGSIPTSGLTGQVLTQVNGGTAGFQSPAILDGNGGVPVSATPYLVQCDSGTALLDRNKVVPFVAGSSVVTVPDSTGSGCTNMVFAAVNKSGGSLTFNASGGDTFDIYDGNTVPPLTGQTTFALGNGQYVTLSNGRSTIWEVRITKAPTLDNVLNPVANASLTFPIGATTGLTLLGTAPASSGSIVNGNQLFSFTAPAGGINTTSGVTAGNGGGWFMATGPGGTANQTPGNPLSSGGVGTIYLGAAGKSQGGPGAFQSWGRLNVDANSNDNTRVPGQWTTATFPANLDPGVFARNTNSTQGNTINNSSGAIGWDSHMQINSVDTNEEAQMIMFPGVPTANSMTVNNGNNPDITMLLEILGNNFSPFYLFCLEQGGTCLSTVNGGGGIGGLGGIFNVGSDLELGGQSFGQNGGILLQAGSPSGTGHPDVWMTQRNASSGINVFGLTSTQAGINLTQDCGTVYGLTGAGATYTDPTNTSGGNCIQRSGSGTGNATPSTTAFQGPIPGASGTTQQTMVNRLYLNDYKNTLTSGSAKNILSLNVAADQSAAVVVHYNIILHDTTNHKNCSLAGEVVASAENSAATIVAGVNNSAGLGQSSVCTSGDTLSATVQITNANPAVLSITPTWTTIVPTASYIVYNYSDLSDVSVTP